MAEVTDSQRLWEAWFQAFNRLREAWPESVETACPNPDHGRVRIAYVAGGTDPRVGTAFVWCDSCRQGIWLGRVGIPDGADALPSDATDDQVAAVIPEDVDFLPPDPAPQPG